MSKLFKSFEYGTTANSYDWLKALALLTMVVDHLGKYFFPELEWLRVIGRIAAPIFLFLVGYNGTFSFNRYLLVGAVIVSAALFATGEPLFPLNILWSIFIWRAFLHYFAESHPLKHEMLVLWLAMIVFYLPVVFLLEYGTVGLMFALLGWYARRQRFTPPIQACWATTFAFWLLTQSYGFGFHTQQVMVFALETALLFTWLYRFRIHIPAKGAASLHTPVLLLARNTLVLYVAHVVLFAFAAHWLNNPQ